MVEERPRVVTDPPKTVSIVIFDGDSVIGEALAVLLASVGYRTRFFPDFTAEIFDTSPEPRLIIFPPASNAKQRDALVAELGADPIMAKVPFLELVAVHQETNGTGGNSIAWPCPVDRLKCRIESALLTSRKNDRAF